MPKRVRANVFDVNRTDRDAPEAAPPLSQLLPRATPSVPTPVALSGPAPAPSASATAVARHSHAETPGSRQSRPRGAGGRATSTPTGITATAARVPVDLYEAAVPLVKGVGRPSWGQKVAWTCQNHRQEVVEATVAILRPVVGVLIPRGQNKQAQATTQVTARFTADEYVAFSSVLDEVRAAAAAAGLTTPVTATALVIAALEVGGRHPA